MEIREEKLSNWCTMRVGGKAKYFVEVRNQEDVLDVINKAKSLGLSVFPLGSGSNIFFKDDDFEGLICKVNLMGKEILEETEEYVLVEVMAGENWDEFVGYCVEEGFSGVENLSLIPGTVGATPIQNVGAYGSEVSDTIVEVKGYIVENGEKFVLKNENCGFGYRESIFNTTEKGKYLITSVVFSLKKKFESNITYGGLKRALEGKEITLKSVREAVIEIRSSKLPDVKEIGNAGSYFKNVIVSNEKFEELVKIYGEIPNYEMTDGSRKIPTGWLLEQCDLKGCRMGDVGTYGDHALVVVNHGTDKASEILKFEQCLKDAVYTKFGLEIVREPGLV